MEKLDAYGKCKYTIGTGDDFIALDFLVHPRKRTVEFEAVVNTETGAYCGDFAKAFEVPFAEAYETAVDLCFRARDWCFDGGMTPGHFAYRNPSVQFTMDVDKAVKRAQK